MPRGLVRRVVCLHFRYRSSVPWEGAPAEDVDQSSGLGLYGCICAGFEFGVCFIRVCVIRWVTDARL